MSLSPDTPVGELATAHPLAMRVLARHRIDFCCGGWRPLSEACDAAEAPVDTVLAELQQELSAGGTTPRRWDEATLDELIQHILDAYHVLLREELPRLE